MRMIICPTVTALSLFACAVLMVPMSTGMAFAQPKAVATERAPAEDAPLKQIALTDKMIENALAANAEMSPIIDKLPHDDAPDQVITQLDAIAEKYGFANYADYNTVSGNINLVLGGFDPETKKFIGQDAVLKKEMAEVQADNKIAAKDKNEILEEFNDALKSVTPLQFPENAEIVAKYLDKLMAGMPQDTQ